MARSATAFRFETAPVVAPKRKATPSTLATYPISSVSDHASLVSLEAVVKSARLLVADELRASATALFIKHGAKKGTRPENFRGTEGKDEVTFVHSRRPSDSPLSDDEAAMLSKHRIPFHTEITPVVYSFNEEHLENPVVRALIQKALSAPGIPRDVIIATPATVERTVSDDTLAAVFKSKAVETLLPVVTRFSMRAKADVSANIATLWKRVGRLIGA